jgi:hypothetical protein
MIHNSQQKEYQFDFKFLNVNVSSLCRALHGTERVIIDCLLYLLTYFFISGVGLWVLRPLLAYCTSPG